MEVVPFLGVILYSKETSKYIIWSLLSFKCVPYFLQCKSSESDNRNSCILHAGLGRGSGLAVLY